MAVSADLADLSHPAIATLSPPKLQRLGPPQPIVLADWRATLPFALTHVATLVLAVLWPPSWELLALCAASWYARILGISLGLHRYFAHRTFKTSRAFQLLLAVWSMTSAQRGVLWWAGQHRNHHRFADQPDDIHSPARSGFFWSHVGWIIPQRSAATPIDVIRDMARFPELRWLDRHEHVVPVALGALLFLIGGMQALVWGMLVSTVLLWHTTFSINSIAHLFGSRRYPTTDTSRNNVLLALLAAGEGWHNNHHYFCSSARLGFRWWEIDPTWYLLVGLEKLGLIWDVSRPPEHVLRGPDAA